MALKLVNLLDHPDRLVEYLDIMDAAFGQSHNGANRAMKPLGVTPRRRAQLLQESRDSLAHPSGKSFSLVVIDEATDEAIGIANWKLRDSKAPPKTTDTTGEQQAAPLDCNAEAMRDFFGAIEEMENAHLGQQDHWYLSILATKPGCERRGAGKLGIDWGLQQADKAGLPAYVHATATGKPLYQRNGWKVVEERPFDCRKYGVDMDHVGSAMVRPARSSGQSDAAAS